MKKNKDKSKNGDRLNIAVAPSFFVGDDGELTYQASVHPRQGDKPAWLAILFGRVGNAPEIPQDSGVPAEYRTQIASAVQQAAQWEFEKLASALTNSQTKAVIQ